MTIKQKFLRLVYPLLMRFSRSKAGSKAFFNSQKIPSQQSIYSLGANCTDGTVIHFNNLKGKKMLIVNTASNCGYTPQYAELEQLQKKFKNSLVVIAFPSNDFKQQEPLTNENIKSFCQVNYGIDFPIVQKSTVKKEEHQHPVFTWLTHREQNGWNDRSPVWNFTKYLVDEKGNLMACFPPFIAPLSPTVIKAIEQPSFISFEP